MGGSIALIRFKRGYESKFCRNSGTANNSEGIRNNAQVSNPKKRLKPPEKVNRTSNTTDTNAARLKDNEYRPIANMIANKPLRKINTLKTLS